MRALVFLVALGAAQPALAQDYRALSLAQDAQRAAADEASRQREVALANQLSVLQAQAQTDRALSDLAAQRARQPLPTVAFDPNAPLPVIDTSKLATIPDATLADSNARVRAAAENRR